MCTIHSAGEKRFSCVKILFLFVPEEKQGESSLPKTISLNEK
jgi:hypothetical protein